MKRQPLKPCGTPAAYRRHIRHGEEACAACLKAHSVDVLAFQRRGPAAPRELMPCGSDGGYHRHKRRKEPACVPCLKAHVRYEAERVVRKRAA